MGFIFEPFTFFDKNNIAGIKSLNNLDKAI
jgi:hypothetical protein